MPNTLEARIAGALTNVRNPRVGNDVISAGMVADLSVSAEGAVVFTFLLGRDDPASLVREARKAVQEVEGVTGVRINVKEPATSAPAGRAAPVGTQAAHRPPPAPVMSPDQLGRIIAVSSGKGGVGKSTVAANLAVALAAEGKSVGLMDADVYGPNVPRMFGVNEKPPIRGQRIVPLEAHGVKLMSLGFMMERDTAAIWRGPIVTKVIQQFLRDVDWGTLDYLIVDMPPGTGDAQLSLAQSIQLTGAVIVTTPQEVAIGDALRSAKMFERVSVPVLGVVENMAGFVCPHCNKTTEIFLSGGGEKLAAEVSVDLLGRIPLQAGLADQADAGAPVVIAAPDSPAAKALIGIAKLVQKKTGVKRTLPILTG
jgi:ATP-binding protein involved in chromosome partitioning